MNILHSLDVEEFPFITTNKTAAQDMHHQVQKVLQRYFDALHEADAGKMDSIFHPHGVYATADESPALIRDKQTYLDVLQKRESPRSRGEKRKDHIDSIEFAGTNTARARVRCSIGSSDFVDYLTLIRDEDSWQIISKIFQILQL